ncbi:MAG: hypothetical protein EOP85_09890 [Verrucomicrobiaceae bacterium]|nr:MAG: hypothetical protein EOP85_09890 [Verrucomicrobiaceae bacterium]
MGVPFVVGVDDRTADQDNDGASNAAEWIAGTNPKSAATRPKHPTVTRRDDNTVLLQFPCEKERVHQLEYSDDLITWRSIGPATMSKLNSFTARVPVTALSPQRFYRLKSSR